MQDLGHCCYLHLLYSLWVAHSRLGTVTFATWCCGVGMEGKVRQALVARG